jgi:hypothetical protein
MKRRRMTQADLDALNRPPLKRHAAHSTQQGRRKAQHPAPPLETDECRTFIAWTQLVTFQGETIFRRLAKIPNERGKAGAMTAVMVSIGMKPGFPDYVIHTPSGRFHGLYLEAKREGETPKAEQTTWRDDLRRWGYHAEICKGALEMIQAVRAYMDMSGAIADGSFRDNTYLQDGIR